MKVNLCRARHRQEFNYETKVTRRLKPAKLKSNMVERLKNCLKCPVIRINRILILVLLATGLMGAADGGCAPEVVKGAIHEQNDAKTDGDGGDPTEE